MAAALWPERARALVSITGYNIQDIARSGQPQGAAQEHRYWYQWYFQTERGREGLARNRRDIARLLWQLWSPGLRFDEQTFAATAASFDNPDFVDVSIHSYRHRYGHAPGDPGYAGIERALAAQPAITVPTIVLHGTSDGVAPPEQSRDAAQHFSCSYERREIAGAGHFLSREKPDAVVEAVRDLSAATPGS